MNISVVVGQFPVTLDLKQNLDHIISIVNDAHSDELVVLPEGALSGYSEDASFIHSIDVKYLEDALHILKEVVAQKGIHLIFGTCLLEGENWYNEGLYFSPLKTSFVYRKINLAIHERGSFVAGFHLPRYAIQF